MKNITLIKELNETIRKKDEFEKALDEAGIEFDMGNGETEDMDYADRDTSGDEEFDYNSGMQRDDEQSRIADHWREQAEDMGEDELRDAIGDELEQLDYSPEDISAGLDKIMGILGFGEEDDGSSNGPEWPEEVKGRHPEEDDWGNPDEI